MAVLRNMADAVFRTLPDACVCDVFSVKEDFALRHFLQSGQCVYKLRLSVAVNPRNADNLTASDIKRNVFHRVVFMHLARHRHMFNFQDGFRGLCRLLVHLKIDVSAHHHFGKLFLCGVFNVNRPDIFAFS